MSGPKTCSYTLRRQRQQEAARRRAEEERRRAEHLKLVRELQDTCDTLERRRDRTETALEDLKRRFPGESIDIGIGFSSRPSGQNLENLRAYSSSLEAELAEATTRLEELERAAMANASFRSAVGGAAAVVGGHVVSSSAAIEHYLKSKADSISIARKKERMAFVSRVVERVEDKDSLPAKLEHMIAEYVTAADDRAEAMAAEIRLSVQRLAETRKKQKADANAARMLLDDLAPVTSDKYAFLEQKLELVAAGVVDLSDELRWQVRQAIEAATQSEAGSIVHQALEDLGYEVTGIDETLFVEGGVGYFKKSDWNGYAVRLSARPQESRVNFNVIRIGESAAMASDAEIENAWCSQYDALITTLRKRGMDLALVRHLPAGSVPIPRLATTDVPAELVTRRAAKAGAKPNVNRHQPGTKK